MNSAPDSSQAPRSLPQDWDAIIIGGALSGAATALQLLKTTPTARILIIEANEKHARRVGESTVEVSAYFLSRVLGLSKELSHNHISKQGLRFIFANEDTREFHECSEAGPKFNVLFPGYQIDRARLDEVVLAKAIAAGAHLLRPAKVTDFFLEKGGRQRITVREGDAERQLTARWLVDASGVRALIARKNDWIHTNTEHPIATAWTRWKNVMDWDSEELAAEAPAWSKRIYGVRNSATNHLMGKGWWAWWIPLQDGDVSIGIVYDQRIVELPKETQKLGNRIKQMLQEHPAGERLLRNAEFTPGDVKFRRNFSYYSECAAGDGFALIGDALGFIDPFYSPGLDWVCYSVMASAKLIGESLNNGETCPDALSQHNELFLKSYQRWFHAIYKDKYYYIGDYDLMKLAFRLDLAFYYLGVVSRPFLMGPDSLTTPSFGQREGKWPSKIIGFYNRRLAQMGKRRMANGRWGKNNARKHYSFFSYRLNWTLGTRLAWLCGQYALLEIKEFVANSLTAKSKKTQKTSAS